MLEKQLISVNLAGGVETKTDKKLVLPGKLTLLENGLFEKTGSIIKRPGYDKLADTSSGDALNVFNDELLLFDASKVQSYAPAIDSWTDKGQVIPVVTQVDSVIRNSYEQTQADSDVAHNAPSGVAVYAWKDSSGGVRATVVDELSGNPYQSNVLLNATAQFPKVLAYGGNVFVIYVDGTSYKQRLLNPSAPGSFAAEVTIAADVHATTKHHDVAKFNDKSAVYAYRNTGGNLKVAYLDVNGVEGTTVAGYPNAVTVSEAPTNCVSILVNPNTFDIFVAYHNGSNALRCVGLQQSLVVSFAPVTVDSGTSPNIINVTGVFNAGVCEYYYELTASNAYDHLVKRNTVSSAGSAGTAAVFKRSVGLASKAFLVDALTYVTLVHQSTLQTTYFLSRSDGFIVGRSLYGIAGGITDGATLPKISTLLDGRISFACGVRGRLVSENNDLFSLRGVSKIVLNFNPDSISIFQGAQLGENLHVVGGFLSNYDGLSITEHGFHLYPENIGLTQAASGGSMSNGTYQYCAVWEWTDNRGQVHRSAPSVPVSIVMNGGGSSQKITVAVPTLRLTAKTAANGRSEVVCAIYRTEGVIPGSIFYRVTSVSAPTYNDTTADSISFVDTMTDAALISKELLYTTGGVLSNDAPPSCSLIATSKNRVFLAGLEDQNSVAFSKGFVQNQGVAFSDYFRKRIDPRGGRISALAVLDEKVIIFKKDSIFFFSGDGPNDTGSQDSFTEAELISSDVGCVDPRSIVLTSDGLVFKSSKGIYILYRYLKVEYIGAPVEAFNGLTLVSSDLLAEKNQVRFTHLDGVTLVYDYYAKQWGTFTNCAGKDSVVWQNAFVYVRAAGAEVYKENLSAYTDNNVNVSLKLATAWIKTAGIQGFQRVYRAIVVGDYKSDHIMRVSVGYDYSDDYTDVYLFNAGSVLESKTYGDGTTYGDAGIIYGDGSDGLYQFVVHMSRQKCQAVRFMFEDVVAGTSGPSFTISDLTLEVGTKRGVNKVGASKRI